MSSATALAARYGKFQVAGTVVARTQQWSVSKTLATSTEWGDSSCAGFTARAPGRKDATFSSEGKYDTTDEQFDLFQPEDIAIATLWMDNATLYWDFPRALNNQFDMVVNIDTEEVIGWTSEWGADGVFHYPGEVGAASRSLPP